MTSRSILLLHGVESDRSVWWRMERDLTDLGHDVRALDLLGHGGRTDGPAGTWTIADFARDVAARSEPVDLLVGHSLGAVTALTLAALQPGFARAVLVEDPPGGALIVGSRIAVGVEHDVAAARSDPAALEARMLAENPAWAVLDARHSVAARQVVDVERVAAFLRAAATWDLPALVRDCPVPLHLLVADGPGSALTEPARTEVLKLLDGRVTAVASGHSVFRDRPGIWLATVLGVLTTLDAALAAPSPIGPRPTSQTFG